MDERAELVEAVHGILDQVTALVSDEERLRLLSEAGTLLDVLPAEEEAVQHARNRRAELVARLEDPGRTPPAG